MMRVADYILDFLSKLGVKHLFMVSGGGMMFLLDAMAVNQKIKPVCTHHEQAAAMAAVSYAKYTGNIGACFVTTGCGGTNAITGLLNGYQDSTPCMFISGQVKRAQTKRNSGLNLRVFGVQEADIVSIVEPITKYAVMVNEPSEIAYHLEKAAYLAIHGRPGPVWIDVPMDVQSTKIDEASLKHFNERELKSNYKEEPTAEEMAEVGKLLAASKRPVIIMGHGIMLAKAIPEFKRFVEEYKIPCVSPYLGVGVLPTGHPQYIGCIGSKGSRAGNFAVQNSDLVLSIGSSMHVSSVAHEYTKFARAAKKIVVDIDTEEHKKKTINIDLFVNADAKKFLQAAKFGKMQDISSWSVKCIEWKERYPVCLSEYKDDSKGINLYYFVDVLSRVMEPDAVVVSDAGSAFYVTTQAINLKEGQRYITSGGQAEMGYTLPACVGVSFARDKKAVIGITGDGSFQMNIHELQTLVYHNLPVKLFVWNNDGYLSIRATQRNFFNSRFMGTDSTSGVSFPDTKKIADAYGIRYFKADSSATLADTIRDVLAHPGPVICEVMCIRDQEVVPAVSSFTKPDGTLVSRPMEDMYPFLSREEFRQNMIIPPLDE